MNLCRFRTKDVTIGVRDAARHHLPCPKLSRGLKTKSTRKIDFHITSTFNDAPREWAFVDIAKRIQIEVGEVEVVA